MDTDRKVQDVVVPKWWIELIFLQLQRCRQRVLTVILLPKS